MTSAVIFTTLDFICNLQMGCFLVPFWTPFGPSVMENFSLLGPFISYKENEVFGIWYHGTILGPVL